MVKRSATIHPPRDLVTAGQILQSVFALADYVNPFLLVSQPKELEMDAVDRESQVAGFLEERKTRAEKVNADRLARWAGRYRVHSFGVPLELPAWDHHFPAAESGEALALLRASYIAAYEAPAIRTVRR